MRYTVRKSYVWVLGTIWMPARTASQRKELSTYDLANLVAEADGGPVTRDVVEQWLTSNSGDFQHVQDFAASLEIGDDTITIPWSSEDNELVYNDTLGEEE